MTTLSDLCTSIDYGYTASASNHPSVGPKYLRITDIVPDSINWATVPHCAIAGHKRQKFLLDEGDIVVARTGATVGYAKQIWSRPEGSTFASYLVRFRPDPAKVDPYYLGQIIQSAAFKRWVKSVAGGAAQPNANAKLLGSFDIKLPSLGIQRSAAKILMTFDDLIENNRRRIEILEEMARLLYREWFVHFRFPGHEDVEMVDSDLGPIPEGWGQTCLGEELELQRSNIKPFEYAEEEFEHYSIPAFDERRLPSRELGSEIRSGKYLLSGESVMVSKLNPKFPRVWRVDRSDQRRRAVASTEFLVMADPDEWTLSFVYGLVTSDEFAARLATTAGGTSTSHQRVKPTDVMNMTVVSPPLEIVQRYSGQVEPLLKLADNLRDQVEVLRTARDLLLPRLVSGELDVLELDLGLAAG